MAKAAQTAINVADWRDACRRGAVLGLVLGLHGLLLMVLLHLDWLRREAPTAKDTPMRLQLLRIFTPTRATPVPVIRLPLRRATRRSKPLPASRAAPASMMTVPSHAPDIFAIPAPPGSAYQAYHAAGFAEALHRAQHGSRQQLPGSDVQAIESLRLKPVISVRDMVHALSHASLCSAELFKMQRQALPGPDIDRLLQADGCGAHSDTDPAVDAAVRQASRQAVPRTMTVL